MNKETATTLGMCLIMASIFFWFGYSIGEEKGAIKGLYEGWDIGYRQCLIEDIDETEWATWVFNNADGMPYKPLDECGFLYSNGTYAKINCDALEVDDE